ncbi:hypothetical protein CJD36_000220 [Flavipsychrobacter stenotrophus]|uniref:Uncharacterized protein n=1 Tax=Flavipsychrobacter stenotrophus TaxID=2077091 RepID=A0A2S7T027_9BACT|nr:T9SS type A sorting domain-containing protein [Flavipsychrobacter stenotrophus]PQJ12221.1 hypothetical protein CJD36_000220 [Flavipsychrobacter stenotrophus]
MKKLLFAFFMCSLGTVSAQNIHTYAGTGTAGYSGDGAPATAANLNTQYGVWGDTAGNIYFADALNNRIRKVSSSGIVTTIAGTGVAGFSGDGGSPLAAKLDMPIAVNLDAQGNIYIADMNNNRIRKITVSEVGSIITTIAGNGTAGYTGDGNPATSATLNQPQGVFVDRTGNVLVADNYNNAIRKIAPSGIISTIAGNGSAGYTGDGVAATATSLNREAGVCTDTAGNIYIADAINNRIRMINTAGIITTIAGTGVLGYNGDGLAATATQLRAPKYIFVDNSGDVYFSDADNYRVRKLNRSTNTISTIAGTGTAGSTGDEGPAVAAKLNFPQGIFIDKYSRIFIGDGVNHRIRVIGEDPTLGIPGAEHAGADISIYPNPTSDRLVITSGTELLKEIVITNMLGAVVYKQQPNSKEINIDVTALNAGIYIVTINGYSYKILKEK